MVFILQLCLQTKTYTSKNTKLGRYAKIVANVRSKVAILKVGGLLAFVSTVPE
jgi:hypothetical protein